MERFGPLAELGWSHPWALAALVLVPLFAWLRHRRLGRDVVPFAPLQLRAPGGRLAARARLVAEALLLALVVVALAGPHRSRALELIEEDSADLMLVLDVSLSMLAEDVEPNRLEALRRVARALAVRRANDRIGLVVFAKDTFLHSPLTGDQATLLALLDHVTPYLIDQAESGGTAIGDALLVAAERLARDEVEGRDRAIVLITDGESNEGIDPVLAARWVRELGLRLVAIGIGGSEPVTVTFEGKRVGGDTPYLAALDDSQLRAVAEAAGGRYHRAHDRGALEAVFGELSRLDRAPLEVREVEVRAPHARNVALAMLPLFALALALGAVLRRPLR